MERDFENEFIEKYSEDEYKKVEYLLDKCLQSSKTDDLENENWSLSVEIEKIHTLQHTYYITLNNKDDVCDPENECEHEINLTYENGIDNGTELRDYSLDGGGGASLTKMEEVFSDIEMDWDTILIHRPKASKKIAQAVFDCNKDDIIKLINKQNYDNYVTGGGTDKTDRYYKDKNNKYHKMGLYWTFVYKETEVNRNFI